MEEQPMCKCGKPSRVVVRQRGGVIGYCPCGEPVELGEMTVTRCGVGDCSSHYSLVDWDRREPAVAGNFDDKYECNRCGHRVLAEWDVDLEWLAGGPPAPEQKRRTKAPVVPAALKARIDEFCASAASGAELELPPGDSRSRFAVHRYVEQTLKGRASTESRGDGERRCVVVKRACNKEFHFGSEPI